MKQLAEYGPIAIFVAVYFMTGKNIYTATTALMISYSIGMVLIWLKEKTLSRTHQALWAFLIIFGGLTLYLQDDRFIMWKPTIANWAIGAAFLGSQYFAKQSLIQKMFGESVKLSDTKWKTLNWMWVAFFFVSGLANIYVAYNFPQDFWVKFKFVGLIGFTILFSILQGIWLYKNGELIEDDDASNPNDKLSEKSDMTNSQTPTTRLAKIQNRLQERFPNAQIHLEDESHLHAGHAGAQDGRGHFRLQMIAAEFTDLSRLKRHQLVYATLGDLMQSDIHALAIDAKTSEELF